MEKEKIKERLREKMQLKETDWLERGERWAAPLDSVVPISDFNDELYTHLDDSEVCKLKGRRLA